VLTRFSEPIDAELDEISGSKKVGGFLPSPTPAGVPVLIRSPGSSVMKPLIYATSLGTEKMSSLVRLF